MTRILPNLNKTPKYDKGVKLSLFPVHKCQVATYEHQFYLIPINPSLCPNHNPAMLMLV